jgi:hypothetical protein
MTIHAVARPIVQKASKPFKSVVSLAVTTCQPVCVSLGGIVVTTLVHVGLRRGRLTCRPWLHP